MRLSLTVVPDPSGCHSQCHQSKVLIHAKSCNARVLIPLQSLFLPQYVVNTVLVPKAIFEDTQSSMSDIERQDLQHRVDNSGLNLAINEHASHYGMHPAKVHQLIIKKGHGYESKEALQQVLGHRIHSLPKHVTGLTGVSCLVELCL